MINKQNFYLLAGILISLSGIILFIIRNDIAYYLFDKSSSLTISVIASSLLLYGVGVVLYGYLQFTRNTTLTQNRVDISAFEKEIEILRLELLTLKSSGNPNAVNQEEIDGLIRKITEQNLGNKNFLKLLENKFGTQIIEHNRLDQLSQDFENINERISFEIQRLNKSANVNLIFGSVTTLIAIGFLAYEVLYKEINFTELIPLLSHYIPRIAIVIFVEIFAFFFLKIYKTNLTDIKYFHNEKTNIDLKFVAIKAAIITKNETIIEMTIREFATTERNFVLKKDESTIELEKEKIDLQSNKSIIDALKDIVKIKT
ncbi:MAG: hypothetical protein ACTHNW_02065 [Mucilaginibacter sp.]